MLQIKHVSKQYVTGDLAQKALNDVSLDFRDSEFVAILGHSGSGKTTMLNIIGGLDTADSGDLIINGISTEKYKDRDWDTYRNHTIGFIFQSYNLIPHQSVLANVELALTLSGVSKAERKRRAKQALMIGIITYISVLERTQEIGILRAIGASKRNVSSVFTAETLVVGLIAGLLGVAISALLCLPISSVLRHLSGINELRAALTWQECAELTLISMLLTLIAGLIPSGMAAKKDPVAALRSE